MKLYVTPDGEWYTSYQAAGSKARQIEVPWEKKESLAAWLTEHRVLKEEEVEDTSKEDAELKRQRLLTEDKKKVDETLRRIAVEEEIQNCDLPRLAVLASNVAWRFKELSEGRS